jgi:phage shock protein PspC (stress-responsive transcriptional regulator)
VHRAVWSGAIAFRRKALAPALESATLAASITNSRELAMYESDELGKLGDLHQRGVLSDDEFARAKARVLNGAGRPGGGAPAIEALHALQRSRDDRWLGGVCGGIARITGAPAWLWRLLFTLLFLCGGAGALLYVLLWIFVPQEPGRATEVGPASRAG